MSTTTVFGILVLIFVLNVGTVPGEARIDHIVVNFPNISRVVQAGPEGKQNESSIWYWYDLERAFMKAVQPYGITVDFAYGLYEDFVDNGYSTEKLFSYLGKSELTGITVLFSIGVVYIVGMFLAAIIFVCCRCCCKPKYQKHDKSGAKCNRFTMSFFLLFLCGSVAFSVAMMHSSFDDLDTTIQSFPKVVNSTFSSADEVMLNIVSDVLKVSANGFAVTTSAVINDLALAPEMLSKAVYDSMEEVQMRRTLEQVSELGSDVDETVRRLERFAADISSAQSEQGELFQATQNNLVSACAATNCSSALLDEINRMTVVANYSADFNLTETVTTLQQIRATNLTDLGHQGSVEYDSISAEIQSRVPVVQREINASYADFEKEIDAELQELRKETNYVRTFLKDITDDVDAVVQDIVRYRLYGWYLGIALTVFYSVLLGFLVLGCCSGATTYKNRELPTERHGCVIFGGYSLIFPVYFILFFSWIFMIATTALFLVGTQAEASVCPIIQGGENHSYSNIDQFLRKLNVNVANRSIGHVLSSCARDESLYDALELDNIVHLDEFQNQLNQLDIFGQVNSLDDSVNVDVPFTEATNEMNSLTALLQGMTFDSLSASDLSAPFSQPSIPELIAQAGEVQEVVNILQNFESQLNEKRVALRERVSDFESYLNATSRKAQATANSVAVADSRLRAELSSTGALGTALRQFGDREYNIGQQLVNYAVKAIRHDIGHCGPLARSYDNITDLFCEGLLSPINGIWFAFGLILMLSIPLTILATRLSRYYSRMKKTNVAARPRPFAPEFYLEGKV